MKTSLRNIVILFLLPVLCISCNRTVENPFLDLSHETLEVKRLFEGERFPNVVVATDGTVIATWGGRSGSDSGSFRLRRSEDGGETWGPEIIVADPGFHGGGVTVDETTGSVFAFVEEGHPPAPLKIYRSDDHGKTWAEHEAVIRPDINGNVPSMHMNERGITLKYGKYAGRLIRPARHYSDYSDRNRWGEDYTTAIYSDDNGITWHTSDPFPVFGTGEAVLEELYDGSVYYNSRRHVSTDGKNPRMRYIAYSFDGGVTWADPSVSDVLPDGPQDTDYGLMAGLARLPLSGTDILLFSNVKSDAGRKGGTVWVSFDGGRSWPVNRVIDEGTFAYSSMVAGRPGTPSEGWIYLLYEGGGHPNSHGYIARFNLGWVVQSQDKFLIR